MGHVKKCLKLNHVDLHIFRCLRFREEMRAKNTATLTYSHEHRNSRSSLRLGTEVVCICQLNKRLATLLTHQKRTKPTPSDSKSNSGICPAYDAECGKVANMVVVCDRKQKSKITDL